MEETDVFCCKKKKLAACVPIRFLFHRRSFSPHWPLTTAIKFSFCVSNEIDHYTVVDLVPYPSSECEAEVDLVLIQTSYASLWKLSLKN